MPASLRIVTGDESLQRDADGPLLGPIVMLVTSMEARLTKQSDKLGEAIGRRFENLEREVGTIRGDLDEHLQAERDQHVATEARVRPIRTVGGWFIAHWRDLLLFVIAVAAVCGFLVETFGRMLGPHVP